MDADWIIVGSGFGGSVSALRLAEKGYRVVMLEKGRRLGAEDFPKTNWDLRRWMWLPALGFRGLFRMTFFRHVTVLSGVGVGGGSLVYANTLPVPEDDFFQADSWGHLADWKRELAPHYATARRMLGATANPVRTPADDLIREVGEGLGRTDFRPTDVAIFFGEPGTTVKDPYFGGQGPDRTGCTSCGACMTGCRVGAKNTLDKNYLYLAEKRGLALHADTEVTWVRPLEGGGYQVTALEGARRWGRRERRFTARRVVFAGGVLGTLDLLLRLRERPEGLPRLSPRLGDAVRTNSEALIGIVSGRADVDMSKGIAIGSIVSTDDHSHLEPVRYGQGSGFWRTLMAPHVGGASFGARLAHLLAFLLRHPRKVLRAALVRDWSRHQLILLYMRTLDGHLALRRRRLPWLGGRKGLATRLQQGPAPTASIPEATAIAHQLAEKLDGAAMSLVTETLLGIPSTAHILGGCCMGSSPETGVIDPQHRVFGYQGLYVIDGSAISANPGVNPSLTIAALAERAMSFVPGNGDTRV